MKKLMIAAAVAAIAGGVYANSGSNCQLATPPAPTQVTPAAVYAWKFTGKTTIGKLLTTKTTDVVIGSNCSLGSNTVTTTTCAIRVPGSLAIQGYVYYCDNCCDAFESGTAGATLGGVDTFYMTKPFKDTFTQADITIDFGHIIGTKATQYETKGLATFKSKDPSVTYTLTFAGLGSFDKNNKVVKSVSGNFAGTAASPYYVGKGVCEPADYWLCDPLPAVMTYACAASDASVAYGTWSVKYNSSASKKYKDGYTVKLPSWTGLN